LIWVLRASYRLEKATIIEGLEKLLSTTTFSFEDRDLLRAALDDYAAGSADFSDYVIGRRNVRAGCEHTVTFDRRLSRGRSFAVL